MFLCLSLCISLSCFTLHSWFVWFLQIVIIPTNIFLKTKITTFFCSKRLTLSYCKHQENLSSHMRMFHKKHVPLPPHLLICRCISGFAPPRMIIIGSKQHQKPKCFFFSVHHNVNDAARPFKHRAAEICREDCSISTV